jgi:hypothetical protein
MSDKISDKAKEMGLTPKELISILNTAGYNYTTHNQTLKSDALQYLFLEQTKAEDAIKLENATENAVIVNIGDKFAVVRLLINSKLETVEVSRQVFESKNRAYYELNYLNGLLETGR